MKIIKILSSRSIATKMKILTHKHKLCPDMTETVTSSRRSGSRSGRVQEYTYLAGLPVFSVAGSGRCTLSEKWYSVAVAFLFYCFFCQYLFRQFSSNTQLNKTAVTLKRITMCLQIIKISSQRATIAHLRVKTSGYREDL